MIRILTFLFFLAGLASPGFAQYDPKALEILDGMSKKYKAIPAFEADISYTLSNDADKVNEETTGRITVKGNMFKLALKEQTVINNGVTVWTYLPEEKEVTIDDADDDSEDVINPAKLFEIYKKGYKYTYLLENTENGVLCDVVDLVPEKRDAKYFKIRMMIARKDKSIKSFTLFDKTNTRYKYTITKFTPLQKIDDSFFTFDIKKYPGVTENNLKSQH